MRGEILLFFRIGHKVVEVGTVALEVVDIFEVTFHQAKGKIPRAGEKINPCGGTRPENVSPLPGGRRLEAQKREQGRRDVYRSDDAVDNQLVWEKRRVHDHQRHLYFLVVDGPAVDQLTMFAKRLAVISGDDQQGTVRDPHVLQPRSELSNQSVGRMHGV